MSTPLVHQAPSFGSSTSTCFNASDMRELQKGLSLMDEDDLATLANASSWFTNQVGEPNREDILLLSLNNHKLALDNDLKGRALLSGAIASTAMTYEPKDLISEVENLARQHLAHRNNPGAADTFNDTYLNTESPLTGASDGRNIDHMPVAVQSASDLQFSGIENASYLHEKAGELHNGPVALTRYPRMQGFLESMGPGDLESAINQHEEGFSPAQHSAPVTLVITLLAVPNAQHSALSRNTPSHTAYRAVGGNRPCPTAQSCQSCGASSAWTCKSAPGTIGGSYAAPTRQLTAVY